LSKNNTDPSPDKGLLRTVQGQAISTIGGVFAEHNDSDTAQNPALRIQSQGKNQK